MRDVASDPPRQRHACCSRFVTGDGEASPMPPRCAAWSAASPAIADQPSYWSQIRAARQIGERRSAPVRCFRPPRHGWMDQPHRPGVYAGPAGAAEEAPHGVPQDDDERFIVGTVLTLRRRHPSAPAHRCWTDHSSAGAGTCPAGPGAQARRADGRRERRERRAMGTLAPAVSAAEGTERRPPQG